MSPIPPIIVSLWLVGFITDVFITSLLSLALLLLLSTSSISVVYPYSINPSSAESSISVSASSKVDVSNLEFCILISPSKEIELETLDKFPKFETAVKVLALARFKFAEERLRKNETYQVNVRTKLLFSPSPIPRFKS